MAKIAPHTRINDILLGPLERPALLWMAQRMPRWVTPDVLTGIGVFASVIIFVSYWLTTYDRNFLWLASFGFVLNWFGDSLDGNLARFRHIERPKYGYFIDHTVDAFSELLVGLGIGLSPYVNFELALLALIGYMLMSVLVYITTYVKGVFQISYSKIGPTEVRLILIIANTIIYFVGNPLVSTPFGEITVYDSLAVLIAVVLFILFIVMTFKQAAELAKLEMPQKN
ncbi:MAG: CDP-alcohol phosphatidyltransferase family protein [Bacteroidota bacterium]